MGNFDGSQLMQATREVSDQLHRMPFPQFNWLIESGAFDDLAQAQAWLSKDVGKAHSFLTRVASRVTRVQEEAIDNMEGIQRHKEEVQKRIKEELPKKGSLRLQPRRLTPQELERIKGQAKSAEEAELAREIFRKADQIRRASNREPSLARASIATENFEKFATAMTNLRGNRGFFHDEASKFAKEGVHELGHLSLALAEGRVKLPGFGSEQIKRMGKLKLKMRSFDRLNEATRDAKRQVERPGEGAVEQILGGINFNLTDPGSIPRHLEDKVSQITSNIEDAMLRPLSRKGSVDRILNDLINRIFDRSNGLRFRHGKEKILENWNALVSSVEVILDIGKSSRDKG
jgi:hypothetical protein